MAFAGTDRWIPTRRARPADISETLTPQALPLEWGGTGVVAVGANDTERAQDVLKTWGMLDSGLLVPRALLPTLTAADASNAGASGIAPQPAAGKQKQALTGGAAYSNELEIASVVKADSTKIIDFEALGDSADRLYTVASASTGRKVRLGSRSTIDLDVDIQFEPLGRGQLTRWGDPLLTTVRPHAYIMCEQHASSGVAASLHTHGLPTPTVQSPGAAIVSQTDSTSTYAQLTYDKDAPAPCGLFTSNVTRRQWQPTLGMVFRVAAANSRFWFGLFDGDPVGLDDIAAAGIKGVGMRLAPGDSNTLQLVTSNGTSQTVVSTAMTVSANVYLVWKLRFLDGTQGWEFAALASNAWSNFTLSASTMPAVADPLGIYVRLSEATTAVNRSIGIKKIWLNHN